MTTTNKLRFYTIFLAIALAATHAPVTQAQVVQGPSISMANLTNGQTLVVGDKAFTDFSISGNFNANQVMVTPIIESGDFGIRFSGALVSGGTPMDLILGYQVSVTNSPNLIADANLLFNGVVVNGPGLAEITEQVYTNNNDFYGQMFVFATESNSVLSASLPITPPQPFLNINKDVLITAELPAFSSISTIDQTFTQVPEPSTLVLAAAGIAGLTVLRRRRC
jgi:PEP-CTERM motif